MLRDWCMESWGSSGVSGAKLYFWFAAAGELGDNMHAIRDAEGTGT
jgi:hypothetical protein